MILGLSFLLLICEDCSFWDVVSTLQDWFGNAWTKCSEKIWISCSSVLSLRTFVPLWLVPTFLLCFNCIYLLEAIGFYLGCCQEGISYTKSNCIPCKSSWSYTVDFLSCHRISVGVNRCSYMCIGAHVCCCCYGLMFCPQELQRLVEILELTHELLSEHVKMDPFNLMMSEMTETISLVSFSGRVATQVRMQKKRQMFQLQQIWQTTQSLELDLKTLNPNNEPQ